MSPAIREFAGLDPASFGAELFNCGQPAVLRGLIASWPAVAASRPAADGVAAYLRRLDNGSPVDAIMTAPEVGGRVFYSEGMDGFNFVRNRLPVSAILEQLQRYAAFARPPSVAVQSALLQDCLPGFAAENPLALPHASAQPRIWIGNRITTPTHLDEWHNIGCVVCGCRRFTLFPPEQVANLYVGPLDFAPTGAPMSLVRLHDPDFGRFPRFRQALAAAVTAELAAGDAIYIPPLWWHHVESLASLNVLVNYWWHAGGGSLSGPAGFDALLHAMLAVRPLPQATREAWRALFDHYVFGPQETLTGHIPPSRHGLLGALSAEGGARLRAQLARKLGGAA